MGTRVFLLTQLTALQDHPHAYGDKSKGFCTFKQALGSSPRVWGQAALHFCAYQNHGIIPTRMGTRKVSLQYVNTIRDHPHAYGDKEFLGHIKLIDSGSSPRVWGQARQFCLSEQIKRIIPTRMGTRQAVPRTGFAFRDHPHAYGDKRSGEGYIQCTTGSSPRVWGQVIPQDFRFVKGGIIPTRVGTRSPASASAQQTANHPHACGDKEPIGI